MNDLPQKLMVLLRSAGVAASFKVAEDERAQHRVRDQGSAQSQVRQKPPEAPCTFHTLVFNASSFILCHGHLIDLPRGLPSAAACLVGMNEGFSLPVWNCVPVSRPRTAETETTSHCDDF